MIRLRNVLGLGFALVLLAALWILASDTAGRADDADKSLLASLISRALSTPASRVTIGAVEGALSSDATIRDITIADRDGVWLRLDSARIVWRRLALLTRRLEIDRLQAGRLEILRRPIPSEQPVPGEDQPLLPELPVKLEIKDFALAELALGEPLLGVRARVSAVGAASLGSPAEGLALRFDAKRLDAPGTLTARLGLIPTTQALDLTLAVDEPAGGILARAANIPGLPPVRLDLGGRGTLDAFAAELAFAAGPGIGASGTARVRRDGAGRRLGLELAAQVEGLLPDLAAPIFAGTTRLSADSTFADAGGVTLSGFSITSATARLNVAGRMSADQVLDLTIAAASVPTEAGRTRAGAAEIGLLALDGTVSGPLTGPRVAATLKLEDARLPAGRLARLEASLSSAPEAVATGQAARTVIEARARASGVVPADPALAKALGDQVTLTLRTTAAAGAAQDGVLDVATPTVKARYAGRLGGADLAGQLRVEAADLARFGDVAGLSLRGAGTLVADLSGVPRANRFAARIDAHATRLATGLPAVDGALGGKLDIAGGAELEANGRYRFQDLRLVGAHAQARLDGTAGYDAAGIDARLQVPDLKRLDERLSGRGEATGRLTGTLSHPDLAARIAVTGATALGRPIPTLIIETNARDLTDRLDARATLSGEVDRKALAGTVHVARQADRGWTIDGLDATLGSVALRGAMSLDARGLAAGRLAVKAGDLDDLSPLALTRLAGSLDLDISLETPEGRQNARVTGTGTGLRAAGAAIERFQAGLAATDLYGRPVIDGSASADSVVAGGETISRVRFDAKGTPQASDLTVSALARGFDLDARGRLVPADPTRLDLAAFTARRGARRVALAGPASLSFVAGGVTIRDAVLALGSGRLSVNGRAGADLDLRLEARAVPLDVAEIAVPGLGLSGVLDGEARIQGSPQAPSGEYRVRLARLVAPQTRSAGLPPIDVAASGRLANQQIGVDATVSAARAGSLRVTGEAPLSATGRLDLAARGTLDMAVANAMLGASGRKVGGRVAIDMRVGGDMRKPQVSGGATLSGGSFADAGQGIRIDNINARVAAQGEELTLDRATGTTRNGGTLAASGRVRVDPDAGFPGTIRVTGRRAELVASGLVTASADLDLALSGALARDPRVSGRIDVVSMDVTVPDRLPATLRPLDGTRHLHPTATARARLAQAAKAGRRGRAQPPFDAVLDLTLSAPGHIYVRGRGLDAELGGDLRLTGTLAAPVPVGAFTLRRGRVQILGKRLDFSRGRLAFTGTLSPELDFLAETQASDVTAQIAVTGPADEPAFTFSSSPDLPQDEVLSRILFGKASGGLSTGQALALAQAAAQFSSGGNDAFESLRKSLGLQGLDISLGASGGPGIGLSKAINDRISIDVKTGISPEQTGIGVNIDITRRIRAQGEVGAGGNSSVGVGAEWDY